MTADTTALSRSPAEEGSNRLVLRESRELQQVPAERESAPAVATPNAVNPSAGPVQAASAAVSGRASGSLVSGWPAAVGLSGRAAATPPPELTWAFASLALAGGVGWVVERRRRLLLEREADSAVGPAGRKQGGSVARPRAVAADSGADSSEIGEDGPSINVFAISETTSRREATLVDLHQLLGNLTRLRGKRDARAAAELLEGHLVDFRYTSPWVFLELRELYRVLDQPEEWELARDAFRVRFGQNAPQWGAPSTAAHDVADDVQLCQELLRKWPRREARMFILRWMLGDANSRQKSFGPPQLALGVYRDMMFLDAILDDAMVTKTAPTAVVA